jgi:hypothetical protein
MVVSVVALVLRVTRRRVSLRVPYLLKSGDIVNNLAVFVCIAALAILDKLDKVDHPTLSWWLAERQLPNGGLNGRPEKLEDVNAAHLLFILVGRSGLTSTRS